MFALMLVINIVDSKKINLFDSTQIKEDLNWSKISFKESTAEDSHQISKANKPDWLKDKLESLDDDKNVYGWKESSFSLQGAGNDVWRIHFTCDLNEQNIQNWLFIPPINTLDANRLTLNLTFTIRECNKFPIKQVVKNCREKFELYYEEIDEDNIKYENTNTNEFFLNKIKRLIFQDTFVSDTGLRYYNSVVDRKRNQISTGDSSSINIELREIPLSLKSNSYIRFAIRDTGACISLLSVKAGYTTCSEFSKFGITFPETSTGKDLTDLVQVNGKCPLNSISTQIPKAICTAKGEWLITDQNLSDRCQCMPGYEFVNNQCRACQMGYYKSSTSNNNKCLKCPANSWSFRSGQMKCKCQHRFYRETDQDYSSDCKPTRQISSKDLMFKFTNQDRLNVSLNSLDTLSKTINIELKCNNQLCRKNLVNNTNTWLLLDNMIKPKFYAQKYQFKIIQKLSDKFLTESVINFNLNQAKHENKNMIYNNGIKCEIFQNNFFDIHKPTTLCSNISINLNTELDKFYPHLNIMDLKQVTLNIHALFKNRNYRLIPSSYEEKSSGSNFINLRTIDTRGVKELVRNRTALSMLVCNLLDIEYIKLEMSIVSGSLDLFTVDFRPVDHCQGIKDYLNNRNQLFTTKFHQKASSIKKLKTPDDNHEESSFKVHVILPIILSFFMVTLLIFIAVFFRKSHLASFKEKRFSCDKHIRRFMPLYRNKSDSRKCMNCSSSSSSHSSTASSSSTTSSSSPSTTCTTSQILEQTSKSYYIDPHNYEDPAIAIQEFAQEIAPLDIKIESVIGGGEFGDVCKGKLKNLNNMWLTVAIKTLKCGSSEKNRCDFLTEASIMAQFHHENIICLEGVVTQTHPYMIITEFMENGSLDTFLRLNSWRLDIYDLIKILRDIANGMKYLAGMNFVHRDLAARNILVNKELKCKVADFGLSREIENGNTTEGVYWTKGGKIPVRWTAPEAISHTKFTCSSDVWSYGVVAWEVMSFGERPYWNWSNTDVIKAIEKGFRLNIPPTCPQIIYDKMLDCWETDRTRRPKFKQIVSDLDDMMKSKKDCLFSGIKSQKNIPFIDTNRPNFAQLTSVKEWLSSLELNQYLGTFQMRKLLNLSQVLDFDRNNLKKLEIWNDADQNIILESLKCIHFELNFQNGFLV